VLIRPYDFEDADGKRVAGVTVQQNGQKIASQYTKDNPNGMPEPGRKKSRSGETTWDFSAQLDFLWERLLEFCATVEEIYPRDAPSEATKKVVHAPIPDEDAMEDTAPAPAQSEDSDEEKPVRRTSSSRTVTAKRTAETDPEGAFESKPAAAPKPQEDDDLSDDLPF
jgi:hypothetical protein